MYKFFLIFFNTLIFFLIINFLIVITWPIYSNFKEDSHSYSKEQKEILNMSEENLVMLYKETWKNFHKFRFVPFLGHTETDRNGKFVNFSEDEGRKVNRPNNCSFNIYLYGGSTTFGYNVKDTDTIGEFLQNDIGSNFCVYNHGRSYYYSKQENNLFYLHLENQKKIDYAIFLDGINERCGGYDNDEQISYIFSGLINRPYNMWKNQFITLIYSLPISQFFNSLIHKSKYIQNYDGIIKKTCDDNISMSHLFEVRTQVRHGFCIEANIKCFTFIQPMPGVHGVQIEKFLSDKEKNSFKDKYALLKLGGKYSIDLGFVLEDAKEQSYIDGVHYTPMTNSKIAKAIKKYIIE